MKMQNNAQIRVYLAKINDALMLDVPVHPQRTEHIHNISNKKRQDETLAAEKLLMWCVWAENPKGVPFPVNRTHNEYGKPYFSQNERFYFNISHSGEWVSVAISENPVGIDIEKAARDRTRIANRIMCEKEKDEFLKLSLSQKQDRIFDIWVLKESIVKAMGMGLYFPLKEIYISFGGECPKIIGNNKSMQLYLSRFGEYRLGVCEISQKKSVIKFTVIKNKLLNTIEHI